jgi:hypothetical protein
MITMQLLEKIIVVIVVIVCIVIVVIKPYSSWT